MTDIEFNYSKIKDVYIVFKTHVDLGFTGLASEIVDKYVKYMIPEAIKFGYEMKNTDTPFVWTISSYIVYKALQYDDTGFVEQAIRDGILCWHALPFTMFSGTMSETLFNVGLDISKKLDEKFGIKTIGAKTTDVPGQAIGMVPLLAKRGVKFMHCGVNPTTPIPNVPPVFKWKCGDSDIAVMYTGRYGGDYAFENDEFALAIEMTIDNSGAPTPEQMKIIYSKYREKYPNAEIHAVSLNEVAEKIYNTDMPIVENDIGNTWSHCVGTDPHKLMGYRELIRRLNTQEIDTELLWDNLLIVPEHTWGADTKQHLPKGTPYKWYEFNKLNKFDREESISFKKKRLELSYEEQQEYIDKAAEIMGVDLDKELNAAIPNVPFENKSMILPFEVSCQIYNTDTYKILRKEYLRLPDEPWALGDFTKYGLEYEPTRSLTAHVTGVYNDKNKTIARLEFKEKDKKEYGLPDFFAEISNNYYTILQTEKEEDRRPQALFLKFFDMDEDWELERLGKWIAPEDIIDGGLLAEIGTGIRNKDIIIESLDCGLVCPFGRRMLEYYSTKGLCQDLYFNLYNNIWNTNCPMWYKKPAKYRFIIKKGE